MFVELLIGLLMIMLDDGKEEDTIKSAVACRKPLGGKIKTRVRLQLGPRE